MTYAANQLWETGDNRPVNLRAFAEVVQPKTLATGSGTIYRLTPMAYNTSTNKWVVWTNGGSNGTGTVSGFLWPDEVTLDGSDDVLANIMLRGRVHFDDIVVPSGETEANLKTALRSGPRALGLTIEGLSQVR